MLQQANPLINQCPVPSVRLHAFNCLLSIGTGSRCPRVSLEAPASDCLVPHSDTSYISGDWFHPSARRFFMGCLRSFIFTISRRRVKSFDCTFYSRHLLVVPWLHRTPNKEEGRANLLLKMNDKLIWSV